jgi:hypothetical protein
MTTADHTRYWLDTATRDWDTVEALQTTTPRIILVFAHWTLEKLSKALCGSTPARCRPLPTT